MLLKLKSLTHSYVERTSMVLAPGEDPRGELDCGVLCGKARMMTVIP